MCFLNGVFPIWNTPLTLMLIMLQTQIHKHYCNSQTFSPHDVIHQNPFSSFTGRKWGTADGRPNGEPSSIYHTFVVCTRLHGVIPGTWFTLATVGTSKL